jgi:aminoglycoside 6'-N-acetyltransferase I
MSNVRRRNMQSNYVEINRSNILTFSDLYVSVFNAAPWKDGWSLEAVHERFHSFSKYPSFFGLGHITNGLPDALAFGWSERWTSGWQYHLKEMCVASHCQRQGLGGKLIAELEQRLLLQGICRVFLETGHSAPAKTFYEQHGYRQLALVSLAKAIDA